MVHKANRNNRGPITNVILETLIKVHPSHKETNEETEVQRKKVLFSKITQLALLGTEAQFSYASPTPTSLHASENKWYSAERKVTGHKITDYVLSFVRKGLVQERSHREGKDLYRTCLGVCAHHQV